MLLWWIGLWPHVLVAGWVVAPMFSWQEGLWVGLIIHPVMVSTRYLQCDPHKAKPICSLRLPRLVFSGSICGCHSPMLCARWAGGAPALKPGAGPGTCCPSCFSAIVPFAKHG